MEPYIFSFVVPAEMIDLLGHMHYLNHRVIAEMAHVALLDSKGLSLEAMLAEGFALHMKGDSAEYHQEVKLGDTLDFGITAVVLSIAAIEFNVNVSRSGKPVADIVYKMVTIKNGRAVPVRSTPFTALVG